MDRIINGMVIVSFISVLSLGAAASFIFWWPTPTIDFKSITVNTKEIHLGEVFSYTVQYCKYTNEPGIVYRAFHSVNKFPKEEIIAFPAVNTVSVKGCNTASISIPTTANPDYIPGEYYMTVDAVFTINGIKPIHRTAQSDSFLIL